MFAALVLAGCQSTAGTRPETGRSAPEVEGAVAESRAAAAMGDYAGALDVLVRILPEITDPAIAGQATRMAAALEDWPNAARAADRWAELDPQSFEAVQARALAALRMEQVDRSVRILADALNAESPVLEWPQAVRVAGTAGDAGRAQSFLAELLRLTGDHDAGFEALQRSRLLWQLGERAQALELAEQALAARPDYERAVWAARLAEAQGHSERALAHLQMATAARPGDRAAIVSQVELLQQLGRSEQALRLLDGIDDDMRLVYTRGLLLNELGRTAEAGATWQRLADFVPPADQRDQHAWLTGLLAELLGMADQAVVWYARVDGEFNAQATIRRALLIAAAGRESEARGLLEDLQRRSEAATAEQAWLAEAQIDTQAGDPAAAVETLTLALQRMPSSADLLYARAMAAVQADRLELAEQDLRTIIQQDPENAMALNALGYTLSDRTDRQREALRLIETALELDPDNPAILDSMGWVLYRLGRADEAVDWLQRAASAEAHPEIVAHLIEVLWQLERREEARKWIELGQREFPDQAAFRDTLERLGAG